MSRKTYTRKKEPQRISKRTVDALKPGNIVWDSVVTGLAVRCQKKAKVFILKYRFAGGQRWYSIGKHGSPWTVEDARTEAQRLLGLVADGVDPAGVREDWESHHQDAGCTPRGGFGRSVISETPE